MSIEYIPKMLPPIRLLHQILNSVCLFLHDDNNFGCIHLKPSVYLEGAKLKKLCDFIKEFDMKSLNVAIVGGIDDEDEDLDGQYILIKELNALSIPTEKVKILPKHKEGMLMNVIFYPDGSIFLDKQKPQTREEDFKKCFVDKNIRPQSPSWEKRLKRSKDKTQNDITKV